MFIMFIRRHKTGEKTNPPKNDKDHLRKHNEDMKKFRLSHPKELPGIKDMITTDGDTLITLRTIRLAKHTQN
jgi:hypothetical protein